MITLLIIVAAIAAGVAGVERHQARRVERDYRGHLKDELTARRVRIRQLETMLDEVRSNALEISGPEQRDGHLIVSAPGLLASERAADPTATSPIHSVGLSIDALPEPLRSELRAIEGEDVQREYLETIQRELAAGTSVETVHEQLFAV